MGIYSLDLELQAILRYGVDYARAHPEVMDEIYENLKGEHMKNLYGDKEIAKIKQWVLENEISVVNAWSLTPQRIPCFSVHIAQSTEDTRRAFLGDHAGIEESDKERRVIVPEFVPDAFDESLGEVTAPDTIDLEAALVRPGHIMQDAKGELYEILDLTATGFVVDLTGDAPDMRKISVVSFIAKSRRKRGESYFQEQVDIGIHGHSDKNTVMWMYQLAMWILLRFKPEIENRCIDLSAISASDFQRNSEYLGENVFSRWVRVTARTRYSWTEDPYPEVDTLVANVHVDDDDNQ